MNMLSILLGMIGPNQIILIVVVILIFFGGRKIPELMRGMGKGIKEFKDGVKDDSATPETEIEDNNKK